MSFSFTIHATEGRARVGTLTTPHGKIRTPAFVPVGTQATVKSLTPSELRSLHVQLFFVNTYHMYLRPGIDVMKKFGGLHQFMNWDGPLITDSGGFQVFSLGATHARNGPVTGEHRRGDEFVKIHEDGVIFTSHWDGSTHFFTPETSMKIQQILGADIILAFDECTSYPTTCFDARQAMERTHRWAKRSIAAHHNRKNQALYGVVQGSTFKSLREKSATYISAMGFDGIAIGGVSVGESKKEMINVLDWTVPLLPKEKPRHLLGVGEFDDIFALVEHGVDTFDCVQPTRRARMGHVFCGTSNMDITKRIYAEDVRPIDASCSCETCRHFSRAYLHHLFRVRELLAYRLATIHNLWVMNRLMEEIRKGIETKSLGKVRKRWIG